MGVQSIDTSELLPLSLRRKRSVVCHPEHMANVCLECFQAAAKLPLWTTAGREICPAYPFSPHSSGFLWIQRIKS